MYFCSINLVSQFLQNPTFFTGIEKKCGFKNEANKNVRTFNSSSQDKRYPQSKSFFCIPVIL